MTQLTSSPRSSLPRLVMQELRRDRYWFSLVIAGMWAARPWLEDRNGQYDWMAVLFQAITAYLVFVLIQRVWHAWRAEEPRDRTERRRTRS